MPRTKDAPLRLPEHLRRPRSARQLGQVKALLRQGQLHTVCEEARCPNIAECFSSGTATFMILGDTCTRRCHFCSVNTGRPKAPDPDEPQKLAEAAARLGLAHIVLTSVDRDELPDKGAAHWARCIRAVKERLPEAEVEVLTPDFKGERALVDVVLAAEPDVFNHNIETVQHLYRKVRPQSRWEATCDVLRHVAQSGHPAVKSGMMVGLGERDDEVLALVDEVLAATANHVWRPGVITMRDLHTYTAPERAPTHVNYRGLDVWSMGPPSSGGSTVGEALNVLEGFDLAGTTAERASGGWRRTPMPGEGATARPC